MPTQKRDFRFGTATQTAPLSRESRRKRRDTWAHYRAEEKEAVQELRVERLVPLAIGPKLKMPDSAVARYAA